MSWFDDIDDSDFDRLTPTNPKVAPPQFERECPKCKGSGEFKGRTGLVIGACNLCNGTGSVSPVMSKTYHEGNTQRRGPKRLDPKVNWENWVGAYPSEAAWVEGEREKFEFAQAMYDAVGKWGTLTEKQLAAVHKCMAGKQQRQKDWKAQDTARSQQAAEVDTRGILEAFQTASESLQSPMLECGDIHLSLAKPHSRNPGCIYVKRNQGDVYLGKISPDGAFMPSRDFEPQDAAAINDIAADPAAAAIRHGKKTKTCACCGIRLTDPRSVELGIGPICAGKWGWA